MQRALCTYSLLLLFIDRFWSSFRGKKYVSHKCARWLGRSCWWTSNRSCAFTQAIYYNFYSFFSSSKEKGNTRNCSTRFRHIHIPSNSISMYKNSNNNNATKKFDGRLWCMLPTNLVYRIYLQICYGFIVYNVHVLFSFRLDSIRN